MYSVVLCLLLSVALQVQGQGTGSVRLYNGNVSPTNTDGIVEVYYNNRWGPVCNLQGTSQYGAAETVCHQLGYNGGNIGTTPSNVLTNPVIAIDPNGCISNNLVILQCSYSPSPTCATSDYLYVTCYSTRIWDSPYSGMVRLQGGYYAGQGRVEVYCNGRWGAVCDDNGFPINTANTVCTQLGYNNHLYITTTSFPGTAWLSNVRCASAQSCLSYCPGASCPSSNVSCTSAANVTCYYDTTLGGFGSSRYTCGTDLSGLSKGVIAAIVIASLIGVVLFFLCIIGIPLCICCCLGVGIGAAASGPKYSHI